MSKTKLSATALARESDQEVKDVFAFLAGRHWVTKSDQGWVLTAAGRAAGGEYRSGKDQGRYIVWPRSVMAQTAVDKALADKTSSALAERCGVAVALFNQVLMELGWVEKGVRGWLLTPRGEQVGGSQAEVASTGIPYVKWPAGLIDNAHLRCALSALAGALEGPVLSAEQEELERRHSARLMALDGHRLRLPGQVQIDNWLYFAGRVHACDRCLPLSEAAYADFYLPGGICIEYSAAEVDEWFEQHLDQKRSLYEREGVPVIWISDTDLEDLDRVMQRRLLRLGIAAY